MSGFEKVKVGDTEVRLYMARGAGHEAPAVVLFHAWWGLNEDATAYADRLAEAGFAVVAPDLFGGQVATTIEGAEKLAGSADDDAVEAIALATIDHVFDHLGPATKLAVLGFSYGAAQAIWAPTKNDRIAATVVYYGTYTGGILARANVPVLGHFAEADPYESDETVTEFEGGLRAAGREATIYRYAGTGHWFAEPSRDAYRQAAADLAFERTVAFLGV